MGKNLQKTFMNGPLHPLCSGISIKEVGYCTITIGDEFLKNSFIMQSSLLRLMMQSASPLCAFYETSYNITVEPRFIGPQFTVFPDLPGLPSLSHMYRFTLDLG